MRRLFSVAIVVGVLAAGAAWIKSPIGAPTSGLTPTGTQLDTLAAMSATQKLLNPHYDLY
jgi:hypothetical protein